MPASKLKVPRVELHRRLWEAANSRGIVKIRQIDLAKEYDISKARMCLAFGDLQKQGRIRRLTYIGGRDSGMEYEVKDPALFPPG